VGGVILLGGKISTTASVISNSDNAFAIMQGRAYTDENRSFIGQVWQGVSRFSYEGIQNWLGYNISQTLNTTGNIDDVG
jgi:hypothetical protein